MVSHQVHCLKVGASITPSATSFQPIKNYMQLSREERRAHLRLDESCLLIGGIGSQDYRGLLAHHLKTTIPRGDGVCLCHACNVRNCSNPNHLYWGTFKDNHMDMVESGTYLAPDERIRRKYGEEALREFRSKGGKKGGKITGERRRALAMSDEEVARYKAVFDELDTMKRGWVNEASHLLGISHTQVRRIFEKLNYKPSLKKKSKNLN